MSVQDGIFWLASYPKSGNTWMRIFLNNYITDGREPVDVNNMGTTPIASGRGLLNRFIGIDSSELLIDEIEDYRPDVYIEYAHSSVRGLMLADYRISKVHDAYWYLPDGRALFPLEATRGIIYIIRNVLDVAPSFAAHNGTDLDRAISLMLNKRFALAGKTDRYQTQMRQKLFSWVGHVDSWNNVASVPRLLIRYEDMSNKPTETFGRVVQFLGMPDEPERLEKAIDFSSFDRLKAQEEENGFQEKSGKSDQFFRKGKIGSWRDSLTQEQVARLIQGTHAVMRRYGYIDDTGSIVY